jgi:glutathione peroxidase
MYDARMKRAVVLVALLACSKDEPSKGAPSQPPPPQPKQTAMAEGATTFDPKDLPAPGTAPAAVPITKELDLMWNVPLKTLQGKDTTLSAYKGKALMIVNVASQCGNTPQYATLEALQKKYEPRGFTVVGFPCNQFGGQEPGTSQEIATFCATHYGITFPIMEKVEVNGANRHAVYQALTPIADASGHTGDIRWNFEKFVVSADGTKITRFSPKTKPEDPAVIAAVEQALPK